MLRRTLVGRAILFLFFFLAEFDKNGVLTDLNHRFQGEEHFLLGKFKPLATGRRKTDHTAFGESKTDIANFAEIFTVKQIDHVLLF